MRKGACFDSGPNKETCNDCPPASLREPSLLGAERVWRDMTALVSKLDSKRANAFPCTLLIPSSLIEIDAHAGNDAEVCSLAAAGMVPGAGKRNSRIKANKAVQN